MKILISGGGVAGNALAFWLSKLGHDVTVIERFPSLRDTGLQIDLRGHGIEVLRRMGLEQAFRAKEAPEQGLQVVDGRDRRWAYFPANKSGKGPQGFTSDFEIMRGDLCRIMYNVTKDRTKYIFGTTIESLQDKERGVRIRFTDGRTDTFDLVVGADGVQSATRKMVFGPDTSDTFHPLGVCIAYFTIRRPIQEGEGYNASMYTATGHRAMMLRRHSPEQMQAYLICSGRTSSERLKNARRGDIKEEKEAYAEIFKDAGWQAKEILNSMGKADDFYCERMGLVKLDSWSHGHVTLVGDAGYCPTATTGMGTTSGIVGAYVLAGEIGRHCGRPDPKEGGGKDDHGLEAALKAYEASFRPFMTQVQKGVSEGYYDMMPSTPFWIAAMNWLIWVVSFLRLDVLGRWFLSENIKGWSLPEYEELKDL